MRGFFFVFRKLAGDKQNQKTEKNNPDPSFKLPPDRIFCSFKASQSVDSVFPKYIKFMDLDWEQLR